MVHVLWSLLLMSCLLSTLSYARLLNNSDALNNLLCNPNISLPEDTQLLLSSDIEHILSSSHFCLVSNTSNITLTSTSETPAIVTCTHQNNVAVGFGFYNVSGLIIENIYITNCGGPMPSANKFKSLYPNDNNFYFNDNQLVTLLISYSSHINLINVDINTYYGFAILLINPKNNASLTEIEIYSSNNSSGGSGLIIYFSNVHNRTGVLRAHVLLKWATVKGSFNLVQYSDVLNAAKIYTKEPKAISAFAAGMTVIFSQGDYSASVHLSHTYWEWAVGGIFNGLAFIFSDAPVGKADIVISNSKFNHNMLGLIQSSVEIGCMVTITNTTNTSKFINDDTEWTIITVSDSAVYDRHFQRSHDNDFSSFATSNVFNHSVIHVITSSDVMSKLQVHFNNITFSQMYHGVRNPFILLETANGHKNLHFFLQSITTFNGIILNTALNAGKFIFVNTASVWINGDNNVFQNMTGSVIQVYNSDIHLNGIIVFSNNKASHGPAIQLDSLSHLFIHNSTNVTFTNNSASFYGGAIYSYTDRNLPITSPLCAIQVVSLTISQFNGILIFVNNTAELAGNSIYVSPLYNCKQLHLKEVNLSQLYNKIFHFNGNKQVGEISSVAVRAQHCSINGTSDLFIIASTRDDKYIKVYPGQTITVGLQAYDLNNNPTYAQIFSRLSQVVNKWDTRHNDNDLITRLLPKEQQIQTVYSNSCTPLKFTIFPKSTSHNINLYFEVLGYPPTSSVKLLQCTCPLGFIYSNENKTCGCSSFLKGLGITQCNIDTTSVNIPPQSWLGVVTDSRTIIGYTEHCPPEYCLPNATINITQPDIICRGNRVGWLCGECKKGYSIVLGSSDCYKCSNSLQSALKLTLVILGGILYVVILFSLRLTIDFGTLGGFIFWQDVIWPYAIPSSGVTFKSTVLQYMVFFLSSIKYHWSIPMCVTSNLNELGKIGILYFFPFYFWLIVAAIVISSHWSNRIANLIFGSSIQVLVTLMYISYSDLLSISLRVLTPALIHFNSTDSSGNLLVWFIDGSVLYSQNPYHIVLVCVSIVVLCLFIVPFILIGLLGVKMLRSRIIAKYFRPFIDAIHGPYKENQRHWFGLRLIVLTIIYIIIAILQGSNKTLQLLLLIFILGSFTFIQGIFLPYKNKMLNALDLWFMVLLLVNFIVSLSDSSSEDMTASHTLMFIEVILCFITYCIILLYHGCISSSRFRCIKKCAQYVNKFNFIKRIRKQVRKSRVGLQHNAEFEPLLREDDSFMYQEWEQDD